MDVFVEQGIEHIFVCSGGGRLVVGQKGHVERADGVILDNLLHGADMVCVRVRGDNGIERCDAERLKVAFDGLSRFAGAGINKHVVIGADLN